MSVQSDYERKYGSSTLLKTYPYQKVDKTSKSTLTTYTNNKNNKSYCACLDCRKTFLSSAACPDCGEKTTWFSNTSQDAFETTKKRGKGVAMSDLHHFFRPVKQNTYVSRKNNEITKMDFVSELEMFTIYPSNRMHVSPVKISTSYDFIDRSIAISVMNYDNPENPELMGAVDIKDAFTYPSNHRFAPIAEPQSMSVCIEASIAGLHVADKKMDNTATGIAVGDILEKFISQQKGTNSQQFSFEPVEGQLQFGFQRAQTAQQTFEHCGMLGLHDAYHVFCEKTDLTDVNIKNKKDLDMFALVNMGVCYPAVMNWQLSKIDLEFQYQKEPMSKEDQTQVKLNSLLTLSDQMATIDDKILRDLKKQNTAENVESYLQYLTFGKNPDNTVDPNHVMGRIAVEDAKNEGFGRLKSLRKNYNKNPLGTANLIYTAGAKIGFRDINHINQLLQLSEQKGDYLVGFVNHTIAPVQERRTIRFLKQYAKSHSPTQMISDVYHFDETDEKTYGSYDTVGDCVTMYENCAKVGTMCTTKEETDKAILHDTKLKISHMREDEHLSDAQVTDRLRDVWGRHTEACAKLVLDDLDKNGKPAEEVFFYGRDGKPLLSNRTLREIHEELSEKQGMAEKLAHGNRPIPHTDEDRARFNREIGGYTFQLSPDTYDLVRTGEQMQICVGGYGDSAVEGRCHIITMANARYEKVACIEIDSYKENLSQFKAFRNTGIPVECVASAKQWLQDTQIKPDRCRDYTQGFGHPDYAPYGTGDMTAVRFPANPIPPAFFIFKAYESELPKRVPHITDHLQPSVDFASEFETEIN